eukprot:TRINITY_DN2538_c0_g2_i1.p1 TRINITY_DN2538_c0_g2~~TRINITY_DN2538_c0_g2_i1.p1  ORF type:complete len:173 (-),score=5.80 TRINITY_DN2538_c0_g2_i1:338-790(-)
MPQGERGPRARYCRAALLQQVLQVCPSERKGMCLSAHGRQHDACGACISLRRCESGRRAASQRPSCALPTCPWLRAERPATLKKLLIALENHVNRGDDVIAQSISSEACCQDAPRTAIVTTGAAKTVTNQKSYFKWWRSHLHDEVAVTAR